MSDLARPRRHALSGARQRGQAMLLTVLLLAVGVAAVVYTLATPATLTLEADKRTAAALAQAKDALIGYAASDANRPGSLPCPDLITNIVGTNVPNDGVADLYAGAECPSYVGRLPWRTLGLPDLRDGSGERLWYAVSREFARNPACGGVPPGSACPHNSDSPGQLTVGGTAGIIAVVFSPGAIVNNAQVRGPANENTVANYLEGGNENGAATLTYVTSGTPFNDRLLPITSDALFNVVNVRVAKEALIALEAYRAANGYYPDANAYTAGSPYNCQSDLRRGRFPLAMGGGCGQAAWGAELPAWFPANHWNLVTHYAISSLCGLQMQGIPPGLEAVVNQTIAGQCDLLGLLPPGIVVALAAMGVNLVNDPLSVTGISDNVRTLVIVTGRALGAQVHPCASVGGCLEDLANTDGDATYVKPSRFPTSNDRMGLLCNASAPCAVIP